MAGILGFVLVANIGWRLSVDTATYRSMIEQPRRWHPPGGTL